MSAFSKFPKQNKLEASTMSAGTTANDDIMIVIPTIDLPVLSPGYSLPSNTMALEASTSRYFKPGQTPYKKRSRGATEADLDALTTNVLDALYAEESGGVGSGAQQHKANAPTSSSSSSTTTIAHMKAHLTKLFRDPVRSEHDMFRLVDVAGCRRVLQEAAEAFSKVEAIISSASAVQKVSDFTSCLTIGQHHRYRAFVLEWLRHQPSRSAPPDTGEVLKVVQAEQRLFLEVLRREAGACLYQGSKLSLYELLTPELLSFARLSRINRMRQQLLSFLADAKAHKTELLLCCCPPSVSNVKGAAAVVDADYGGMSFEQDDDDIYESTGLNESATLAHKLTPQQLFQRRYPTLRVLQWHMAKLYNSRQTGTPPPFPNPQVQSSLVGSFSPSAGSAESRNAAEADAASLTCPSALPVGSPNRSTALGLSDDPPSRLLLRNLPQYNPDNEDLVAQIDHTDEEAEGNFKTSQSKEEGRDIEETTPSTFADRHLPPDLTAAISVSSLRTYAEQFLLPRFGWRLSKPDSGNKTAVGSARLAQRQPEDVIESTSLSLTFAALLKLFVAHIDTEEPRTSFRIPVRVHLTPIPAQNNNKHGDKADTTTVRLRYHAHVTVSDAVPNVKESRHSVQVAAAEHLLHRMSSNDEETHRSDIREARSSYNENSNLKKTFVSTLPAATPTPPPPYVVARIQLSRSATMQGTVVQGEAAVHAAGGDRIKASAAALSSVKEAMADVAPALPFHVSTPISVTTTPPAVPHATITTVGAGNKSSAVLFILAKMEHLNATSAAASAATTAAGAVSPLVHLTKRVIAEPCPHLLESLSPREMLQLDLIFTCFPEAVVRLHHVQLAPSDKNKGEASEGSMQVLAVQTLTSANWAPLRKQLETRPVESLVTTPSPSEVLATQSWDLLYDTLTWLIDSVVRHAADALRALQASEDGASSSSTTSNSHADTVCSDRFAYFILSNHANLVNTCASARVDAMKFHRGDNVSEIITSTFTESRFAARYVLQDVSELYPDYEPRIDITFEADSLTFLEEIDEDNCRDGAGDVGENRGVSPVAMRLYREPHTWNAETVPFTFRRKASASLS